MQKLYNRVNWHNNTTPAINESNLNTMDKGIDDIDTRLTAIGNSMEEGAVSGVKGDAESEYRTGMVNLTKANLGLGNVDNTSDANKPISTATQTALDGKVGTGRKVNGHTLDADVTVTAADIGAVPTTRTVNGHALSSDVSVTASDVGLGNVVNTGDSDTPTAGGNKKFTTGGAYSEFYTCLRTTGGTMKGDLIIADDTAGENGIEPEVDGHGWIGQNTKQFYEAWINEIYARDVIKLRNNNDTKVEIDDSGDLSGSAVDTSPTSGSFHIVTSGGVYTALTDGSVTKIGTATVGSSTQPVYINGGVPTAAGHLMAQTSTTVASSGWTAESYTSPSGTVYAYKKEVSITGMTADSYVDGDISSGTYTGAWCVESASEKIVIRTATQPSASLTFRLYYQI